MKKPNRVKFESPAIVPGFVKVDWKGYVAELQKYISFLESKIKKQS